jgi:hypothetical protein
MLFRLTIAATVVGAAVGQVCDTYDGGATSFGADPSLGTFILLIFMGALVMCTCLAPHLPNHQRLLLLAICEDRQCVNQSPHTQWPLTAD